ncbi:hypothetical protein [Macrococcus hajekii]|nr:hypothetical protein [Macrococcus hajekii]
MWFTYGAAGREDWYAETPYGEVQVQDNEYPGFSDFQNHEIADVVFYTAAEGLTDKYEPEGITAEGYARVAKGGTGIHKYMLGDNGVVYEMIAPKDQSSFSSGFGEYDDGMKGNYTPTQKFEVSNDETAQAKWKEILKKYQ